MRALLLGLGVIAIGHSSPAQTNEERVYKDGNVVFHGLDFSFLKLIHEDGFVDKNGKPMCNTLTFKYFNEWNEMFLIEKDKFNITNYFAVPNYTLDLATVTERNKAYLFAEGCITEDEAYAIPPEGITGALAQYGAPGDQGLGLVIFVESMNKTAGKCVMHVIFFDRADHTLVKMERIEGTPVGMGFRNYWINAVDNALSAGSSAYSKKRKAAK